MRQPKMFLFPHPWPTPEPSTNWRRYSLARKTRSSSPRKQAAAPLPWRNSWSWRNWAGRASRSAAGVWEAGASSNLTFPRTHLLPAGFEPQEFLQEADVIFLLGVIAPWHPASKKLNPGTKVAVLSDNPLRSA